MQQADIRGPLQLQEVLRGASPRERSLVALLRYRFDYWVHLGWVTGGMGGMGGAGRSRGGGGMKG